MTVHKLMQHWLFLVTSADSLLPTGASRYGLIIDNWQISQMWDAEGTKGGLMGSLHVWVVILSRLGPWLVMLKKEHVH